MVKETNSRYFDSAYFVLKSDLPSSAHDSDMLAEAHRMIDSYQEDKSAVSQKKKKRNPGSAVFITVLCLASAAIITAGVIVLMF